MFSVEYRTWRLVSNALRIKKTLRYLKQEINAFNVNDKITYLKG